jgi:hypothetical protein
MEPLLPDTDCRMVLRLPKPFHQKCNEQHLYQE